jgi:hypothetical protein
MRLSTNLMDGERSIELFRARGRCLVLEDLLERDPEYVGDPESDFERGGVLVAFNGYDGLARDGDEVGKFLLCHRADRAELSYCVAKARAHAAIR